MCNYKIQIILYTWSANMVLKILIQLSWIFNDNDHNVSFLQQTFLFPCKSSLSFHPLAMSRRGSAIGWSARCGLDVKPTPPIRPQVGDVLVHEWRHGRARDVIGSRVLSIEQYSSLSTLRALSRGDERAYSGICQCVRLYTVRTVSVMFWYDSVRIVKTDMHICARKWFFADIKL